ncbi:MAG: hypothetical protein OEN52_10410 [Gammaproteobacteria bacterium]|nr:hypothetical protein [Gammaproteobacteria bacterium]MDH3561350.1 hypothetical protein [Gammaproteobacteria bacterium]
MSNDVAYYKGPISLQENRRFFAAVANRPVRRLVITSSGGEVEAGIALGRWVFGQRLVVEVPEYCLSSCANYVFPAAGRKLIAPGAVVAWHGNYHHLKATGLWTDDIAARMQRYGEDAVTARDRAHVEMERLVQLERDFFAGIGVDQYLCWIGKMPPYNVPNYYFLSREDMAGFGVTQVQTPAGYEHTEVTGLDASVEFISLNAAVTSGKRQDSGARR